MSNYLGFIPTEDSDYYFVSYNNEDADRLTGTVKALADSGVSLWYDYGIEYGEKWERTISAKIRDAKAVLLFFTKPILAKQNSYVQKEYRMAAEFFNKKVYVVMMDSINNQEVPFDKVSWWIDLTEKQNISGFTCRSPEECVEMIRTALGIPAMVKPDPIGGTKPAEVLFRVPEGTVEIDPVVMKECNGKRDQITKIILPDTVRRIQADSFSGFTNLVSINLPDSLKYIGENAFRNCFRLAAIHLPQNVQFIGPGAFDSCTSLEEITIAGGCVLYQETFRNCTKLAKVTFTGNMSTFQRGVFNGCSALTEISLPTTAVFYDSEQFKGCTSLKKIWFKGKYWLEDKKIFDPSVSLTAYYPQNDPSWTKDRLKNYGAASVKWIPWDPGKPKAAGGSTAAKTSAPAKKVTDEEMDAIYGIFHNMYKDTMSQKESDDLDAALLDAIRGFTKKK